MPGVSGVTVVTNARVYYTPRAAAGAPGARHSLRPLSSEGGKFRAKLAQIKRRDREAVDSRERAIQNGILLCGFRRPLKSDIIACDGITRPPGQSRARAGPP